MEKLVENNKIQQKTEITLEKVRDKTFYKYNWCWILFINQLTHKKNMKQKDFFLYNKVKVFLYAYMETLG